MKITYVLIGKTKYYKEDFLKLQKRLLNMGYSFYIGKPLYDEYKYQIKITGPLGITMMLHIKTLFEVFLLALFNLYNYHTTWDRGKLGYSFTYDVLQQTHDVKAQNYNKGNKNAL